MATNYEPGRFSDMANTPFGDELWKLLTARDNVVRMETATELDHPAVDGVAHVLLDRFGARLRDDRTRQFIGHMVRQVMEAQGYEFVGSNYKSRTRSGLFTKGSRYQRAASGGAASAGRQ
nr:hypothetical protein [Deltaproteobacteria bacterium]